MNSCQKHGRISYFNYMNPFGQTNLKSFDYNSYWKDRSPGIRKKLYEREKIFFEWINPGSRVLDVAVGNSQLVSLLVKEKSCKASAFDISESVVSHQRAEGVDASIKNLTDEAFSLASDYDYVIASEILEHLPMPEILVGKIANKTRYILISIPNSAFYRFRLQLLFGRFFKQWVSHPSEHLRFWSHIDFLDWLDALGFEVVKSEPSNGLDIGSLKLFKYFPNLFGHQICYMVRSR